MSMRHVNRSGGTLLEVMLSLLIVGLILHLVLQASAQVRASKKQADEDREGSEAAMRWRASREAGDSWTQGEEGKSLDGALIWRLVALSAPDTAQAGEKPDGHWRVLELRKNPKDKEGPVFHRIVLRLPAQKPIVTTQPSTAPSSPRP